tara:strand:+ start:701 stop:922 length:222 start_codon:yes stop_codon:yes gene_type:complete
MKPFQTENKDLTLKEIDKHLTDVINDLQEYNLNDYMNEPLHSIENELDEGQKGIDDIISVLLDLSIDLEKHLK